MSKSVQKVYFVYLFSIKGNQKVAGSRDDVGTVKAQRLSGHVSGNLSFHGVLYSCNYVCDK